uniref:Uncharacterized protein n=1 Tax=Arundo donax TaxID=35708 RepID=A0A0A9FCR8_ARUDO
MLYRDIIIGYGLLRNHTPFEAFCNKIWSHLQYIFLVCVVSFEVLSILCLRFVSDTTAL